MLSLRSTSLVALLLSALALDQPLKGREHLALNGGWRFRVDAGQVGVGQGWFRAAPADAAELSVANPASHARSGITWYWRDVPVPEKWKKRAIRIRLAGLAGRIEV